MNLRFKYIVTLICAGKHHVSNGVELDELLSFDEAWRYVSRIQIVPNEPPDGPSKGESTHRPSGEMR